MAHWASIIFAPLVYLTYLSLGYALVPLACDTQRNLSLHLTSGIALALTLGALVLAWRERRRSVAGQHHPLGETVAKDDISGGVFLATVGIFVSALFALATAAQWGAQWLLSPCYG
jgi:hypothetical protein